MLQLEKGIVDLFAKSVKEDGLEIDMDGFKKPRTIDVYVLIGHNQISKPRFMGIFKGKEFYSKTKAFKDQRHMDLAVKRVVFKYEFIFQFSFKSTF